MRPRPPMLLRPWRCGPDRGPFGNPGHFVKEFPDFDFQLPSAFLDPIHDIGLDSRAVHVHQMIEKFPGFAFRSRRYACTIPKNTSARYRKGEAGRATRSSCSNVKREGTRKPSSESSALGIRANSGTPDSESFFRKSFPILDKPRRYFPIFLLGGSLFGFQPRPNMAFGDNLRDPQGVSAKLWAISARQSLSVLLQTPHSLSASLLRETVSSVPETCRTDDALPP